jgi:3-oxoacyl-[acyl-carrier protein] reductase
VPESAAAPLLGRDIVLTGASRGFGRALARRFHQVGASLLLVARPSRELDSIVTELGPENSRGQIVQSLAIDQSEPDAAERICSARPLDVLVNCAAIQGPIGPLWDTDPGDWRHAVDVDLIGPVNLMRAAIPRLIKKGGGVVINVSGGGATASRPGFSAYAGAKTALVRVGECVAEEVAPFGVAVTAVAPGTMPTAMLQAVLDAGPALTGAKEQLAARKALEGGEDVMEAALGLCTYLAETPRMHLSGKLLAALWDPWADLEVRAADLAGDVYTLRRILPKDRGKTWGND